VYILIVEAIERQKTGVEYAEVNGITGDLVPVTTASVAPSYLSASHVHHSTKTSQNEQDRRSTRTQPTDTNGHDTKQTHHNMTTTPNGRDHLDSTNVRQRSTASAVVSAWFQNTQFENNRFQAHVAAGDQIHVDSIDAVPRSLPEGALQVSRYKQRDFITLFSTD
jgi:hypothetical protein